MKSWMKLPILAVGAALLSAAAAKADTIIATVGPMTGQYAIFGDQMKRGAELAVAAINAKGAYGKGLADETKKQLNGRGVTEALYEAYTAGEKDYSALVTRLKNAKIELVYIGGYHTDVGLIVRQAREQGFEAQVMSGDAN